MIYYYSNPQHDSSRIAHGSSLHDRNPKTGTQSISPTAHCSALSCPAWSLNLFLREPVPSVSAVYGCTQQLGCYALRDTCYKYRCAWLSHTTVVNNITWSCSIFTPYLGHKCEQHRRTYFHCQNYSAAFCDGCDVAAHVKQVMG